MAEGETKAAKRKIPRWAIVMGIIVAVLLGVALAAPYFLDADRYRTLITSAIEKETGRKASIAKIRARLIPRVGFVIEEVALGNPPGFREGNVLTAEAIRGNLAWGPLLRREFEISSVEIVRPRLVLAEDERGRTNYDLTAGRPPAAKRPAAAEEPAFKLADIDSIVVKDAQLVMARVTRGQLVEEVEVRNLSARLSDVALDAARLKQWKVDADVGGAELRIPGFRNPVVFRSGQLTMREAAVDGKFEMALADVFRARGTLRIPNVEKAVVQFELSAPLLDLDALAAQGADTPAAPAAPPPAGSGSELLARGRIAADRIRWSPYEGSKASAEVRLFTDRLEVWPATMSFYDGSFGVSARVDRRQSPAAFSVNVEISGVDMGKLLAASPETRGAMTGAASGKLQLFGRTGPKMTESLNGNGELAIRDGSFPKFSLTGIMGALGKVEQLLGGKGGGAAGGSGGGTPFRSLTADMRVAGQRIHSNRIVLDSPSGNVEMRGSVGFDQTLNYDGQAVLARTEGGQQQTSDRLLGAIGGVVGRDLQRLSVPFALRGTVQDIKVQPGRGLPGVTPSAPATAAPEEEKRRGILDLLKRKQGN